MALVIGIPAYFGLVFGADAVALPLGKGSSLAAMRAVSASSFGATLELVRGGYLEIQQSYPFGPL